MESIRKLEATVAGWYEKAPHLPPKGREWLAQNVWWIGLIGLVLGVIGVLSVLSLTFWAGTFLGVYGGVVGAVVGSLAFVAVLVGLAFSILLLVLLGMAIVPLRAGKKKGWDLLFISALLSLASTVVALLFSWDFGNFIMGLISAAIGGYFLFEIRSYFKAEQLAVKRGA